MPKYPIESHPTLDRSTSRIAFGMKLDEFVPKSLVIPLAMIVLGVFLNPVLCQNSTEL